MINIIKEYVEKNHMLDIGDRVIVGVSGGADSVCLLHILMELKEKYQLELYVVHVNHGIRGEAARTDEQFVRNMCEKYHLPIRVFTYRVSEYAKAQNMSEEEAGRYLRYQAFEEERIQHHCNKIAVAHNSNDQAETVLFHLFRGTGLKGIVGITPVREAIIRPLLCVSRTQIEAYLRKHQIRYCIDATNYEDVYMRNKIRLHIMPYVTEEINPKAMEHIVKCSNMLGEVETYLQKLTTVFYDRIVVEKNGQYCFAVEEFLKEDIVLQKRMIRFLLEHLVEELKDIEEKHIIMICDLTRKSVGKKVDLPCGIFASRGYETIVVGRRSEREEKKESISVEVTEPGEYELNDGVKISFAIMEYKKDMIIPKNRYTKWFDYDKIKNTIFIRNRKQGDYIKIDQNGGRKKLKSYFIDNKIPQKERDKILLMCDGQHVIWVIGQRISEEYKIGEGTRRILAVEVYGGKHVG